MAFQNIDLFITDIYYLSVNLRDTLIYTLDKYDDSIEHFVARRQRLQSALKPNSPLSHFIRENKESGDRIKTLLENFIDEVYGDDSTILRQVDGKIIPDKAQFGKVFEFIVGIHETITDICRGYIKHSDESGIAINKNLRELMRLGDEFYRSYFYISLITNLIELFKEFNSAMNEAKGQKNENTNYWNGEINKIVTYIRFIKEHCANPSPELVQIFDKTAEVIQYMQGEKPVPTEPAGRTIWNEFDAARQLAGIYLNKVHPLWQNESIEVNRLGRGFIEKSQKIQVKPTDLA